MSTEKKDSLTWKCVLFLFFSSLHRCHRRRLVHLYHSKKDDEIPPLWHRPSFVALCISLFEQKCQRFHRFNFRGWYRWTKMHTTFCHRSIFSEFWIVHFNIFFSLSLALALFRLQRTNMQIKSKSFVGDLAGRADGQWLCIGFKIRNITKFCGFSTTRTAFTNSLVFFGARKCGDNICIYAINNDKIKLLMTLYNVSVPWKKKKRCNKSEKKSPCEWWNLNWIQFLPLPGNKKYFLSLEMKKQVKPMPIVANSLRFSQLNYFIGGRGGGGDGIHGNHNHRRTKNLLCV